MKCRAITRSATGEREVLDVASIYFSRVRFSARRGVHQIYSAADKAAEVLDKSLKTWSGQKDLPALSPPKGTFDLLVPNRVPMLVELYGFLLILRDAC
jgi:hypothetical protein